MKPSIPKGTRDFSPQEVVKRNYIFDTIRSVFKLYGYMPIETPSMENLDTLMGKYGEEGDRLIFKILNSGDFLEEVKDKDVNAIGAKGLTKYISEKALRYDLTVPFARYVVMHQNEITFPFKRYQIQPVWRADRPQKGRYREFFQCDADVIGSDSLLNEVELIQIINDVFSKTKLDIPVIIKLNNRKILQGIAEMIGAPDRMIDIATAMDKVDKVGKDGVHNELVQRGFTVEQVKKLDEFILLVAARNMEVVKKYNLTDALRKLVFSEGSIYRDSETAKKGAKELKCIIETTEKLSPNISLQVDFSLARGLNYYTGTIIEIVVDREMCTSNFTSSIGGGGRYDDLTGIFGLKEMPGVGISFGADRICDVLEELNKFPTDVISTSNVMFLNFGEREALFSMEIASQLRNNGISAEVFPDAAVKIAKQLNYADRKKFKYVVSIGESEITSGKARVKNMMTKEENKEVDLTHILEFIKL